MDVAALRVGRERPACGLGRCVRPVRKSLLDDFGAGEKRLAANAPAAAPNAPRYDGATARREAAARARRFGDDDQQHDGGRLRQTAAARDAVLSRSRNRRGADPRAREGARRRDAGGGRSDPLRLTRLDGDAVARDPGALADEAYAISMFGGARAMWIEAQARDLLPALEPLFARPPQDCAVIVEAGSLKRGAALRDAVREGRRRRVDRMLSRRRARARPADRRRSARRGAGDRARGARLPGRRCSARTG